MTWLSDIPGMGAAQDRASKAMRFPVGAASPLWLAFGAAASAGVAWWLLGRLARPTNLEAVTTLPEPDEVAVAEAPQPAPEPAAVVAEAVEAAPEAIAIAAEPVIEAVVAPPAPVAPSEPDDLTLIVGIGPKLALSLAERGVTTFAHLAAWTDEDLAAADAALSLKGRAVRDAWVAQARRFAAT